MPTKKTPKAKTPKVETLETASTVLGVAFAMPDEAHELAEAEAPQIDFQARQDSISEKRRGPGPKLDPKSTATRAKPSSAKETKI